MNKPKPPSIGVAVITHAAKQHLVHCLSPLVHSPLQPRLLVVNSSSNDGTVEEAQRLGAETLVIPRDAFNHGSTREQARKELGTDIVVMMTPDAYAVDRQLLEKLVAPLLEGKASLAYARQLPHDGAGFFETFHRHFNYPERGHVRGIEDSDFYGSYTFFCSDSCAAYDNGALEEVGGFPSVLIGEDAWVTARLLSRGHKIAYVADAVVKHSHRYGLVQEFRRHFDTGLARKEFEDLIRLAGSDEKRGREYVRALLRELVCKRPWLIPYALMQTVVKWFGYKMGRVCQGAGTPLWLKKLLSSQDFYWVSKDYLEKNENEN